MTKSDELVTSKEGANILGISKQTFFYYVNQNRIRKVLGETPRKTLYYRSDIEDLLNEIGDHHPKAKVILVDWMTTSDLPAVLALDLDLYGTEEPIADIALYHSWFKKNPKVAAVAFEEGNRANILGQCCLLPLAEEVIEDILSGRRNETQIHANEVLTYEQEGEYNLLAESIVVRPGEQECIRELFHKFMEFWIEAYPERQLKKIYAHTTTEHGLLLVQKLYFGPLYELGDNAFVLDLRRKSPSKVVQEFQHDLKKRTMSSNKEMAK